MEIPMKHPNIKTMINVFSPSGYNRGRYMSVLKYFIGSFFLEAVSKPQIALKGKTHADEKAQHTREYVSPPEAGKPF
jgi:hypothetical protein